MSALAHMIEELGIATVVVGLVRPHMEKTKPPRGLWVPFPLGRPFGDAESPEFQHGVLRRALGLLERTDGPVILEDFAEDARSLRDTTAWMPPALSPPSTVTPAADETGAWVAALDEELARVSPLWQAAQSRFGRTGVGVSRLSPGAWAAYGAHFLRGELPASPVEGLSPALVLRYVADDLKALYVEAAQAEGPPPSARQINAWFWGKTIAADFLRALRTAALTSPHSGFQTSGSRFIVPAPFVAKE